MMVIFYFAFLLLQVNGFDDVLLTQSILYGISYLSSNNSNNSVCEMELKDLFNAVEEKHVWALKGK